jgi:hypothetical protein
MQSIQNAFFPSARHNHYERITLLIFTHDFNITLLQVRTRDFSFGGGGDWPWGYIQFMFGFEDYAIKILP